MCFGRLFKAHGLLSVLGIFFVVACFSFGGRLAAQSSALDEEANRAIERGVGYLLKEIAARQVERGDQDDKSLGKIALETYALVTAGVSCDDPLLLKNFEALQSIRLDVAGAQTYSLACYALALDAALCQKEADEARLLGISSNFHERLRESVNALVRLKRQKMGVWNYDSNASRFDNSNTQYAVLGLAVGAKRNVSFASKIWDEVALHSVETQHQDGPEVERRPDGGPDAAGMWPEGKDSKKAHRSGKGEKKVTPGVRNERKEAAPAKIVFRSRGWGYQDMGKETWNMTCGGVVSLMLARNALGAKVSMNNGVKFSPSLTDGIVWLQENWNPRGADFGSCYGQWNLEHVGGLLGAEKIGTHVWFEEIVQDLVLSQSPDGSWPGENSVRIRWNTAFALLTLCRAVTLLAPDNPKGANARMIFRGAPPGWKRFSSLDNWARVTRTNFEVHIPSLLRHSVLRPCQKNMDLLSSVFKAYPSEKEGRLVGLLARSLDGSKEKMIRSFVEEERSRITGIKGEKAAFYLEWHACWLELEKIGAEGRSADGQLRKLESTTERSVPLRRKFIRTIGRCRSTELTLSLIKDLEHPDVEIRQAAYETIAGLKISEEPMPSFDPKATKKQREQQATRILEWYIRVRPTQDSPQSSKEVTFP